MAEPVNLDEWEALARARLSQMAYDYYAGGADDEITVAENREAFRRRRVRYRVLVDVQERDLSVDLFGERLPYPIVLAPTSAHKLAHPDGEIETARGAAAASCVHTVSTVATVAMEDVAHAVPEGRRWFQLYCFGERTLTEMLVKRAHAAGYGAIVVTVDVPLLGRRERDLRNTFMLPEGVRYANFDLLPPRPEEGEGSTLAAWVTQFQTPALVWEDLAWLKSLSPLPLLVKGIVRADDAARALEAGADGVWVSNHGGRQLDRSIPSADALPDIAEAVGGRAPIIVDGGVRRGTDVLVALALGATAVAIGRPQLWGLAAGGAEGVRRVIQMLRDELSVAMALAGAPSLAEIDRDLLA